MQAPVATWFLGYVTLHIECVDAAQVLELLRERRIHVWQIAFHNERSLRLQMLMSDFLQIRPVARACRCKVSIVARNGWPIIQKQWGKRFFFWLGILLAILLLYLLSTSVWRIEISGNRRIADERVLHIAKQQGIYLLQRTTRLRAQTDLARAIQQELAAVAWVGVEVRGTIVRIRIIESDVPKAKIVRSQHHVIARTSAVISHIFAVRGKPLVQVNHKVNRGDVLISGWIGNEQHARLVRADGIVRGLVWYDIHIKVPLKQRLRHYTGATYGRQYFMIGKQAIRYKGFGEVPFRKYHTTTRVLHWRWLNKTMPFGTMSERLREIAYAVQTIPLSQAKRIGIEQARLHFLGNHGKARVAQTNIKKQFLTVHKQSKTHLEMRVFFEVEEEIGEYAELAPPPTIEN